METITNVNLIAVLVGAIATMGLGFMWYSPILFGKRWLTAVGADHMTKEEASAMRGGMGATYTISFVGAFVMAYVLAHVIAFAEGNTFMDGASAGLWMWLGFVATTSIGSVLYEGKLTKAGDPKVTYLINNGYHLASLLLMGAIIAVFPA